MDSSLIAVLVSIPWMAVLVLAGALIGMYGKITKLQAEVEALTTQLKNHCDSQNQAALPGVMAAAVIEAMKRVKEEGI